MLQGQMVNYKSNSKGSKTYYRKYLFPFNYCTYNRHSLLKKATHFNDLKIQRFNVIHSMFPTQP